VTRTYDLVVIGPVDASQWDDGRALRQTLLGEEGPTRRASHAHCQLFGHGGPDTTSGSYLHEQELRVARWMASILPDLPSRTLAALTGINDATIRTKLSRGVSPQSILVEAVRQQLDGIAAVDAWRGLQTTAALPDQRLCVEVASDHLTLPRLDRLLRLHYTQAIPAKSLATLLAVTPRCSAMVKQHAEASALDLGFAPAFLDASKVLPWGSYAIRSLAGRKTPPHLSTLPQVEQMENTVPTTSTYWSARAAVRAFSPAQSCWHIGNVSDLMWTCQWLATIGVSPTAVDIEIPSDVKEISKEQRALTGPMAGAHFTAKEPRTKRKRGEDVVSIRLQTSGSRLTAATLMHATFLWITRASVGNPELRCATAAPASA
jgi:hypothetical protein